MGKTTRIIQLINMLYSRRYVSLKAIKETCGIPDRTAYRYLNTISEANIPVYYEKSMNAYTLTTQNGHFLHDISFGDSVMLILALKVLGATVNKSYQQTINDLLIKLHVRQKWDMNCVLGPAADRLTTPIRNIDLSERLSSVLIHAAVCSQRSIKLLGNNELDIDEVTNPTLRFNGVWQVAGGGETDADPPPLEAIVEVKVY